MTRSIPPFHLALPVDDIPAARAFYGELLACPEGRSSDTWVDFDFYGHQLVVHLAARSETQARSPVDGDAVPVPHFGVVLDMDEWKALAARLREAGTRFEIEPRVRFVGEIGEQATLFFRDPAGNALEVKAFRDPSRLFARD